MSCQDVLLQLEIRSQDSPFIADVLVVERVRWVKTFAQHATLGVRGTQLNNLPKKGNDNFQNILEPLSR